MRCSYRNESGNDRKPGLIFAVIFQQHCSVEYKMCQCKKRGEGAVRGQASENLVAATPRCATIPDHCQLFHKDLCGKDIQKKGVIDVKRKMKKNRIQFAGARAIGHPFFYPDL